MSRAITSGFPSADVARNTADKVIGSRTDMSRIRSAIASACSRGELFVRLSLTDDEWVILRRNGYHMDERNDSTWRVSW